MGLTRNLQWSQNITMWFKKKKIVDFESKYQVGEAVKFRRNGSLGIGIIQAKRMKDGEVFYDVQYGGECPATATDVKESDIPLSMKK